MVTDFQVVAALLMQEYRRTRKEAEQLLPAFSEILVNGVMGANQDIPIVIWYTASRYGKESL